MFVSDKIMYDTVKTVIQNSFLKKSSSESVHTLAAERIAIDLLSDAFRELDKFAAQEQREHKDKPTPHI